MKPVSTIMILILFALVTACGKDNKSGKKNNGFYGFNQLGSNGQYVGTRIAYNGFSVQQVVLENPCANGAPQQYRQRVTLPAQVRSVISNGDIWVGVTSFGDVAVVGGTTQGPILEAYICPRSQIATGAAQAGLVTLLPYTSCRIKQMNVSVGLSDGSVANFRAMDFPGSTGQVFSYCR